MSELINRHIFTLLRRNDCVIVPGLGAFIATYEPACFHDERGEYVPPVRRISFNPSINHDDGLLASSFARRLKISFEQGRERVEAEAALMHRRLKSEGMLLISRVGTLHRTKGGQLDFLPDAKAILALPSVESQKVQKQPVIEVLRETEKPHRGVAIVKIPLHFRAMRVAAAAAILFVIGFALSTPINLEQAHNASLAIPAVTAPQSSDFEPIDAPADLNLNMTTPPEDGVFDIASRPYMPFSKAALLYSQSALSSQKVGKPWMVVVCCMPSYKLAQKFLATAPTRGLGITKSGSHYKVYIAQGDTREEALASASAKGLLSSYPDAWTCHR